MVHQSKKKKTNAQLAKEKTQEENSSSTESVSTEQAQEATVEPMPFDLSKVDPKKIELAEEMGIPIKQLINWAVSVEKRFQIIARDVAAAPQNVVNALKAEAMKAQEQRQQQILASGGEPRQGGKGISLGDVLKAVGGSGGGMDDEMMNMQKEMFKLNIERMKKDMGFTDAIKNAIVTKLAGKAAADIIAE